MRYSVLILFLCLVCVAQKRFQPEYFIEKGQLDLPETGKNVSDLDRFSHVSDVREYFYLGGTLDLQSVHRELTIEGFPANVTTDKYTYSDDTVYVNSISRSKSHGDTTSIRLYKYTDDFRTTISYNPKTECTSHTKFDKKGIKILEVRKCPGDDDFRGQVYHLVQRQDYLDKYKEKNGVIDSSNMRRYYLTVFDSVVADYMVKEGKEPFIVRLNTYGENNRKTMSYGFGIYTNNFEVVQMDKYTYSEQDKLHRVYHFEVKDGNPVLVNYTEYEYDNSGRKVRVTTRMKPDAESAKNERESGGM